MRLLADIIVFVGVPAAILVGIDTGDLWDVPQWLLGIAYTTIGGILAAGILVGIFSKAG